MARGGKRPGAGRPPGSLNRRNVDLLADTFDQGITPVAYMLGILRDENQPEERRAWAAEKAAPYLHPRPSPLDRTISIDLPDIKGTEGVLATIDAAIAAIARGQISPAEGNSLISAIEARRKAIETHDLAERIARLEAATANKRDS